MNFKGAKKQQKIRMIKKECAYPQGKSITNEKKKDLMKMKEIIPPSAWFFYENLISKESVDCIEDVDGLDSTDMIDL